MSKNKLLILEKYVKVAVKKALKEQEENLKRQETSIYLLYRWPGLRESMINLMSPIFSRYISNVSIVAPKPTTFNITLINGMNFYMIYSGSKNFIVKIQGKKYNLINLGETERASQAIANMLELSYTPPVDEGTKKDSELKSAIDGMGGGGGGGTFPGEAPPTGDLGGETPSPEIPGEISPETGAPEDETSDDGPDKFPELP